MNFDDYCQQKAAPPGSSIYYALRQARAAHQPVLTALFALRREFEETVKETSDPTIGRTKLAWWQKELSALAAGQPSHPVAKALHAHLHSAEASYPALQALLAGYEMDLDQARYLDYPNLRRYMQGVGGTFASLVGGAVAGLVAVSAAVSPAGADADPDRHGGSGADAVTTWAAPLGEALMLAQFVADLGDDARHGRIYVPIDEMQRYNVTAADIINRRYGETYTGLMRFETGRARDALQAAVAAIPAGERSRQRTLRALAALALALLDEIERDGYQVLHQRIALTPIRKLWIAWRAARAK